MVEKVKKDCKVDLPIIAAEGDSSSSFVNIAEVDSRPVIFLFLTRFDIENRLYFTLYHEFGHIVQKADDRMDKLTGLR